MGTTGRVLCQCLSDGRRGSGINFVPWLLRAGPYLEAFYHKVCSSHGETEMWQLKWEYVERLLVTPHYIAEVAAIVRKSEGVCHLLISDGEAPRRVLLWRAVHPSTFCPYVPILPATS